MDAMRTAVTRAKTAWNAGDLDGYLELYHPEIVLHGYAPQPMSKPEVRGFYLGFFEAFPKVQLEFDEIVTEGSVLMMRFHCEVVHQGPFMGAPATGRSARLDGHTSMRFGGAHVIERWSTADFLGLMIQLGLMKPPGE
jgi:predicted ester cyclase